MVTRRRFAAHVAALAGAPLLALPEPVAAAIPASTLQMARMLLGAPAGGSGDLMARRLADKLSGDYAKSVIVENRPGAGGQLAIVAVRDAPDDGSVMLLTPSSLLSIYPFTYRQLPYRPEHDLAPVSLAAHANHAFALGPAVPASVKTMDEFLAWARSRSDGATFGSPASGSIPHLIGVVIGKRGDALLRHIPYRGSMPALQDLRGGQIDAVSGPVGVFLPHLKAGQIRLLGVSGDARSRFVPNVPTYQELGLGLTAREWYGFFLPARATPGAVARCAGALKHALAGTEMAEALAGFGLEAGSSTPQQLAEMLKVDAAEWRVLVKSIGFTAES